MRNCFLFSMKLKFIYAQLVHVVDDIQWQAMGEWKTSDTHAKKWHKTCFKDVAKYTHSLYHVHEQKDQQFWRSSIYRVDCLTYRCYHVHCEEIYGYFLPQMCVPFFGAYDCFFQFFFTKIFDAFDSPEQCVSEAHNTNAQNFNKKGSKLWCWTNTAIGFDKLAVLPWKLGTVRHFSEIHIK